jgi:signal transduction histidine kinase/CheY-like chemotaxis protein
MSFKLVNGLKKFTTSLFLKGTTGNSSTSENRITIFINAIAIFSLFATLVTYFELKKWEIDKRYLYIFIFVLVSAVLVLFLNIYKKHFFARVACALLINFSAWNALIFYGKTFNGYLLFYVAIVFSIVAFNDKNAKTRVLLLLLSLAGPPASDYFSYYNILPITGFASSQAPLIILFVDSSIVSLLIVVMLMIEKSLSERNERNLISLNYNLEKIVEERTKLLKVAQEEALSASRAKSQFVANTSHELRTPLGAIIGFVDLILDRNVPFSETKQYLKVIQRNANQLLQIVNEVLDLSKIEAQKIKIEKKAVSLNEFLENLKSLMSLKTEDKGLEFKVNFSQNLPERIYTDPLRLNQILINLIGNAIKFTSKGAISIDIKWLKSDSILIFDISDTGSGIRMNGDEHLFQPFSQGDNSLGRQHGGTGLGLYLSKSLSKLIDGELSLLSSVEGKGSTFRLKLKNIKLPESESFDKIKSKLSENAQLSLTNKTILIVDDSTDNQLLVREYLILAGANVEISKNGLEAIEKIETTNYDVVLMDIQMPVMDGYEAIKILREKNCKIPIIAFTAHAMSDEKEKLISSGFTSYVTKPFQRNNLLSTLAEHSI